MITTSRLYNAMGCAGHCRRAWVVATSIRKGVSSLAGADHAIGFVDSFFSAPNGGIIAPLPPPSITWPKQPASACVPPPVSLPLLNINMEGRMRDFGREESHLAAANASGLLEHWQKALPIAIKHLEGHLSFFGSMSSDAADVIINTLEQEITESERHWRHPDGVRGQGDWAIFSAILEQQRSRCPGPEPDFHIDCCTKIFENLKGSQKGANR